MILLTLHFIIAHYTVTVELCNNIHSILLCIIDTCCWSEKGKHHNRVKTTTSNRLLITQLTVFFNFLDTFSQNVVYLKNFNWSTKKKKNVKVNLPANSCFEVTAFSIENIKKINKIPDGIKKPL